MPTNPTPTQQSETLEERMKDWPKDLIAVNWAETLSEGEQSTLLTSSLRRLQRAITIALDAQSHAATSSPTPAEFMEDVVGDYVCDAQPNCGWRATGFSRPLSRGLKVGCPNCLGNARFVGVASAPAERTRVEGEDRCEHGVLHSMECLNCTEEYVAVKSTETSALKAAKEIVDAVWLAAIDFRNDSVIATEAVAAIISKHFRRRSR